MTTIAIIVAAGSGTRAGGELPKQYQHIGGKPVIAHTVEAFVQHRDIDDVVVVIGAEHQQLYDAALNDYALRAPVIGGASRQQSVFNGLKAVETDQPDKVLIHDAARPFVSAKIISDVVAALDEQQCAIPGVAVVDTISKVSGDKIAARLNRDELRAVQTPQGFVYTDIFAAHQKAADKDDFSATDDSALMTKVAIIAGDVANVKLTSADDILKADKQMKQAQFADLADIRVGQGFDVHAFEPGDHVILCGVEIPFSAKLKGHSDADVAMHALTDAILGALGEGDIGKHFPPTEAEWKGAASEIFLKGAMDLIQDRGGMLAHSDITIICEAPKLRPHIDDMRAKMAEIMDCHVSRVSIKATTSEKLGFTGRGEGIAAMATATVRLPL